MKLTLDLVTYAWTAELFSLQVGRYAVSWGKKEHLTLDLVTLD